MRSNRTGTSIIVIGPVPQTWTVQGPLNLLRWRPSLRHSKKGLGYPALRTRTERGVGGDESVSEALSKLVFGAVPMQVLSNA